MVSMAQQQNYLYAFSPSQQAYVKLRELFFRVLYLKPFRIRKKQFCMPVSGFLRVLRQLDTIQWCTVKHKLSSQSSCHLSGMLHHSAVRIVRLQFLSTRARGQDILGISGDRRRRCRDTAPSMNLCIWE